MRFLNPAYLHLAWLALLPVALYLFRKKARRIPVSTLLFFRSLAKEHQESAWLRRLKRWLSLLLTLAVILLAVLALSRPASHYAGETPGAVVVMLDRSASMSARNAKGESRLEAAAELLKDRIHSLPEQVVASLVVYDSKPTVLLSRSRNRRELLRLLEEVRPVPHEGKPDAALAAAIRLAQLEKPAEIWHAADAEVANRSQVDASDIAYRFINAALDQGINVGITGFQIRKAPLARDRYEAFVQVSAAGGNRDKISSTLEVRVAGRIAQLRELELEPGDSTSLILPLEGLHGQMLEIEARTTGDCLGWDDRIIARLPELKPLLVSWIAEKPDPFTGIALGSLIDSESLSVWKGDPQNWPLKEQPDVYVFENWLPDKWPEDRPVIALNPPRSIGPLKVRTLEGSGLPHDNVRTVAADHPVVFRVSSNRISITQSCVIETVQSIEPLWMAGLEPVLLAGETGGQRVVVTAFSPSRSEQLALLPAYPLLLGNAIYWCAENSEALRELRTSKPGDWLEASGLVEWKEWDGKKIMNSSDQSPGSLIEVGRVGVWETADGKSGVSVLASSQETDVPFAGKSGTGKAAPVLASQLGTGGGNWPARLMWTVLALLVVESFLFHRKAVY